LYYFFFPSAMAIIPKTSVLQVRLSPGFRDRLQVVCDAQGVRTTAAARTLLETFVIQAEERIRRAAAASERKGGASVPPVVKKRPVAVSGQPVGLSDKLRAERDAKKAKKKKREDRWLAG
jgi:hypothetical protein